MISFSRSSSFLELTSIILSLASPPFNLSIVFCTIIFKFLIIADVVYFCLFISVLRSFFASSINLFISSSTYLASVSFSNSCIFWISPSIIVLISPGIVVESISFSFISDNPSAFFNACNFLIASVAILPIASCDGDDTLRNFTVTSFDISSILL